VDREARGRGSKELVVNTHKSLKVGITTARHTRRGARLASSSLHALHFVCADSSVRTRLARARYPSGPMYMMVGSHLRHVRRVNDIRKFRCIIMSATTFLSLPREIRNIIYSYLSHDIAIDWGYKMFPFPIGGHAAVKIHIKNVPFTEVLRICSQVYHEYRQEKRLERPCLAINTNLGCTWRMLEGQPTNQGRVFKILARISHVNFLYTRTSDAEITSAWNAIEQLSEAMAVLAPYLRTIRVVSIPLQDGGLDRDSERLLTTQDAIAHRPLQNKVYNAALGTSLLPHGQQAFWNDRFNLDTSMATSLQGFVDEVGDATGEWRYTRCKDDVYLKALQQMFLRSQSDENRPA
jgi:hypothetical protein